jgi:hypothetical protein
MSSSKFLAWIVSERGIEADPAKVKAFVHLCRNLKELRSLPAPAFDLKS